MSEKGYFDEESPELWIISVLSKKGDMLRPTRHGATRDKEARKGFGIAY